MADPKPVSIVAAVKPLQDKPDTVTPGSDFYLLVMDTLHALDVNKDTAQVAAQLLEQAHAARMVGIQEDLRQERAAVAAHAAMDRVNTGVMQFVKRTLGQALDTNARVNSYNEMLGGVRHDVRELVQAAEVQGADTVPLDKVKTALEHDAMPPAHLPPVIVGMAVDHRFTHGWFVNPAGDRRTYVFIGWSLVIHRPHLATSLEPTFVLEDGSPITAEAVHYSHNWQLTKLQ